MSKIIINNFSQITPWKILFFFVLINYGDLWCNWHIWLCCDFPNFCADTFWKAVHLWWHIWVESWKQRSRNIKFVYTCFTDVAFCSTAGASMGWFVGLTILPLLYKHSEYLSEHNWVPYLILGGFALVGGIAILCAQKVWNIKCYEMSVCFFHNYWCGLITIHIIGTLHWNFFLLISN